MELCRKGLAKYAAIRSEMLDLARAKLASQLGLERSSQWHKDLVAKTRQYAKSIMPVETVSKEANTPGQLLQESQQASDLKFNDAATIRNKVPKMFTEKGLLPKIAMDRLASDPLVQYLKKQAAQDTYDILAGRGDSSTPTNEQSGRPVEKGPDPLLLENPNPDESLTSRVPENHQYLRRLFSEHDGYRKKYDEKDHDGLPDLETR